MAGKASKTGHTESDPATSDLTSAAASAPGSDNVAAAADAEVNAEIMTSASENATIQPDTTDSATTKSVTDAAQEDAASRRSSESDEKPANISPSKKSPSKSKKGSRSSRGKASTSKRSSEEQQVAKDDITTEASSSTDKTNDAATAALADADANIDSSDSSHHKTASTSKELAQSGLSSFGDGAEDDVVGPRRSRRGPGASPDPKARVPKTEPDSEVTSLQDGAGSTGDDASDAAAKADGGDADAPAEPAEDNAHEVKGAVAPEEVPAEPQSDTKPEAVEEEALAPEGESADDSKQHYAVNDFDDDEGEANHGDADEQDGELDDEELGDEGVTRCVCGSSDENVGLMIQCETCKCWQHCVCMGMQVEEDCPDVYFCEQCHPELHIPLLRSLGLLPKSSKKGTGKGGAKYSARELKEAKEAIAMLAQENARRQQAADAANYGSRDRKGSHNSRGGDSSKEVPKSPKRRSTMNSRDSAYGGWEPLPPGLLADGEVWDGTEDRKGGKKRKRGVPDEFGDGNADTPEAPDHHADAASDATKRRRMSAGPGQDHDGDAEMDEDESSGVVDHSTSMSRDRSHKKKKGNNQYTVREASAAAESTSSKPRHPNQYTYRNKDRNGAAIPSNGQKTGNSSTSNLTSHSPSPSPSKGRAENARRAAARDHGSQIGTPAPEPSSSSRGGHQTSSAQWTLPEHLTHLAYLLPHASGSRLEASKSTASAADNGSANGSGSGTKKGSASSSGQTSSVPSPPASTSFPTPFQVLSSIGSSTKVRFPSRRMTMGEMRKRVRNIGEYVTRSQIEAVEREKRMKLLGIVPPYMEEMEEDADEVAEVTQDDVKEAGDAANADAGTEENVVDAEEKTQASGASAPAKAEEQLPLSMRLMEELTRELIHFQRKFGVGPGSNGGLGASHQSAAVN
ncbi:Zinc finger, RING/FYVE/PHD-type [Kalmanozyma brasiliensis GHG001]|uniref:Zinc finger PHD-type domain-containing protein n=1 Tax=Kalmanozyma brasiliensis (strain GHG001) TaxID=1365824 RepID=V5GVU5_KALBG|nr:Zinc finger, RING/FYVE/PHD-type [Kalmanozyma brasiliensis GHG001]EST10017.1 Zinc finger, RING/FYVE/PHD-type [Kalmanozyma brasiliensis GHG001]